MIKINRIRDWLKFTEDEIKDIVKKADDQLAPLAQKIKENEDKKKKDGWLRRTFWPSLTVTPDIFEKKNETDKDKK